jgi:hypothetical protein
MILTAWAHAQLRVKFGADKNACHITSHCTSHIMCMCKKIAVYSALNKHQLGCAPLNGLIVFVRPISKQYIYDTYSIYIYTVCMYKVCTVFLTQGDLPPFPEGQGVQWGHHCKCHSFQALVAKS